MGILLSTPIAIVSAFLGKDIFYCFYYGFIYIYLKICDLLRKKRLDLYDMHAVGKPEKFGFFVPKKEWELDTPQKSQCLQKFTVPNDIVITTEAYRKFIDGTLDTLLEQFQNDIWCTKNNANVEQLCQKTVDIVAAAKLPNHLSHFIIQDLSKLSGDSIHSTKVSVRSSAIGEDTEQMSSAGQMATYLGVQGINEIFQAVTKCWASQFTFQAIEYKRAFRRWKWHNDLDKLIFPELFAGTPKPINYVVISNASEKDFIMTGVPVSQGITKSIARVIMSLDEVANIQPGDILITYSTDIAWSPYFPLLSGVVTELGGLISHCAVVAREYGLPCVVGLHGATKAFKSGTFHI